jgi:hypothetical protein
MSRFAVSLIALHVLVLAKPHRAFAGDEASIDKQIERMEQDYGVRIHYRYDPTEYFSKSWLEAPRSAKGSQLGLDEVERFIPVINEFLKRNPKAVLKKNLHDIYLTETLEFYGKPFGATNSARAIYIHSAGESRGFTNEFLQEGLHHEFSSILMRNYPFPTDKWNWINPAEFSYGHSGVEVIGQKALHGQTDALLSQGFVEKYCQSSMENDFNVVSAWLFVDPEKLKGWADKYEKVAAKRKLAIDFYQSIDKGYKF